MLRTKSGLPEHCYWQIDRHGKRRVQFRKGAFSTYLTGTPWSEHFMRQHAAALDGVRAQTESVGAGRIKAGSVDALIVSYRRSIFPTLAPSTRKTRGYILERFGREHGALPVNRLEREHVDAIFKAMANTPPTANNLLKILRHLLEHAITLGMIAQNPAAGIKPFKIKGDGFHVWSEAEVARFEAQHPLGTLAYLALHLLLDTGQRRSDVVRMG